MTTTMMHGHAYSLPGDESGGRTRHDHTWCGLQECTKPWAWRHAYGMVLSTRPRARDIEDDDIDKLIIK
jgi:hypothetical protein